MQALTRAFRFARSLPAALVAAASLRRQRHVVGSAREAVELAFAFREAGISIAPLQVRSEIQALLERLESDRPRTILEIGTANGGTLFLFSCAAATDATIVSVDLPRGPFGGGYSLSRIPLYRSFARDAQHVRLVRGNSRDSRTIERARRALHGRPLDFLFIDGDHTAEGVQADFETYSPLVRLGGLVALHDIVPDQRDPSAGVAVYWLELKERYETEELVESRIQHGCGIGLVQV